MDDHQCARFEEVLVARTTAEWAEAFARAELPFALVNSFEALLDDHDRLDSFWFTLLHELVHAWKHLPERDLAITDESVEEGHDDDSKEAEANRLARDAFIPRSLWKRTDAYLRPSIETIRALADKLSISPAIVAGRLRREKIGYAAFSGLVGHRQVRKMFPEVKWG